MTPSASSSSHPLTKALFAAGQQCAKRLYLDSRQTEDNDLPPERRAQAEAGTAIIALARTAFPGGRTIAATDFDQAVTETAAALADGKETVLFDAAFRHRQLEVRTDILIRSKLGVELFEVKSGIKVKPRHVRDVAFQVHVLEAGGMNVRAATVLHLSGQYRHGGGDYPVHELFQHVDVTGKVRNLIPKVAEQVGRFAEAVDDDASLDLPTGTFCFRPLTCHYLTRCIAEGPPHPLIELPGLSRQLEFELHQKGIEDLTQIDIEEPALTPAQRRALRALRDDALVVDSVVTDELRDIEPPLHFVDCFAALHVLPRLPGGRPWHRVPFGWAERRLDEDGSVSDHGFVADGKDDPREAFVRTLAQKLEGPGTVICYGYDLEDQLRALLEEIPEHKPRVRALLNKPILRFDELIKAGVDHPGLRGRYDLETVGATLAQRQRPADLEFDSAAAAEHAFDRLLNPRTRSATRDKIRAQVMALGDWRAATMLAIYRSLIG